MWYFCSILTGGVPLIFQLATNFLIQPPIEVNCTGSEQTVEGCQLVRPLQCATAIVGVNCTGTYVFKHRGVCLCRYEYFLVCIIYVCMYTHTLLLLFVLISQEMWPVCRIENNHNPHYSLRTKNLYKFIAFFWFSPQLSRIVWMGNCDWWEVQVKGREGWRCAIGESGEQYLTISGTTLMQLLHVVSWGLSQVVCILVWL